MIVPYFLVLFLAVSFAGPEKPANALIETLLGQQEENIFKQGQAHYQKYCIACHAASNIMVASPKFGDKADWSARLASMKTLKALAQSANIGKGAMPAKGLCTECKEKDLQAAILYMMRGQE
ncbi:hypothetical protein AZI86_05060 [Bdellovibrio bacteriovorus]|uniref:Cytochrome c domain-containing protein n=1 Tax=Bdellovibrio bacteriovorus TaxID=959 RepID=A0A150WPJ1_BDEBC|nr:c-type cytochrome [Bdellovibrio bacteriovorus]KYG66421.1 hypothetical protein AZI86_05060 [Bdellovibrio bacteriovorus]